MARLGIGLSGGLTAREIVACARLAEDLGYESVWIPEGHGGDQFALLAACATATRRVRLGTAISSVFVRSAPTIAMAAATVDDLSDGRTVLGLGSSHRVQVEPEHGVPYGRPIQRVRDTVEVVRALLRDGAVSHHGETLAIERFDLWFAPRRREIPVYLGAVFGPMLEVCGELAQGAILTLSTLDSGRLAAEHVARGARRAGRSPDAVEIASLLSCSVAPSREEARAPLRPALAFAAGFFPRYNRLVAGHGFAAEAAAIREAWQRGDRGAAAQSVSDALVDAVCVLGTADACRERIEAYRRSGIALPIVTPRARGAGAVEVVTATMRALAP